MALGPPPGPPPVGPPAGPSTVGPPAAPPGEAPGPQPPVTPSPGRKRVIAGVVAVGVIAVAALVFALVRSSGDDTAGMDKQVWCTGANAPNLVVNLLKADAATTIDWKGSMKQIEDDLVTGTGKAPSEITAQYAVLVTLVRDAEAAMSAAGYDPTKLTAAARTQLAAEAASADVTGAAAAIARHPQNLCVASTATTKA